MPSIPNPCLMLLTDRTRLTPNWTLAQVVAPAITGGCNLVALRETDIPANHRMTIARFVADGVKRRVPFLISDDAEMAGRIGAQGVHISGAGVSIAEARERVGQEGIVGASISSRKDAEQRAGEGADYLLIEYDWTSPERILAHFRQLVEGLAAPIIVGTDMPVERVAECIVAGAVGVAICSPAMSAYDKTAACRAYAEALNSLL